MSSSLDSDVVVIERPRTPLETTQQEGQTKHLGSLSPPRIIRTYHLKHHSSPGEELDQAILEAAGSSTGGVGGNVSNSEIDAVKENGPIRPSSFEANPSQLLCQLGSSLQAVTPGTQDELRSVIRFLESLLTELKAMLRE